MNDVQELHRQTMEYGTWSRLKILDAAIRFTISHRASRWSASFFSGGRTRQYR